MNIKKSFKVYYLLISEGATEYNLFAYLTRNKFRGLFDASNIKFSDKVEIIKDEKQIVFKGNLGGTGNIGSFEAKYALIKKSYSGQKLFFLIDNDLEDSVEIGNTIKRGGDIVQFVEYNSEYLLLKFAGKNIKKPSEFNNRNEFRDYSKVEFRKHFHNRDASDLKDTDFDLIFNTVKDEDIKSSFSELFATLS